MMIDVLTALLNASVPNAHMNLQANATLKRRVVTYAILMLGLVLDAATVCGSWSGRLNEVLADGAVSWRYCVTSPNEAGLKLKKIN